MNKKLNNIAKYKIGTIGNVINSKEIIQNVVIKDIVNSYTIETVDDYYVVDLPNRPNSWILANEFFVKE